MRRVKAFFNKSAIYCVKILTEHFSFILSLFLLQVFGESVYRIFFDDHFKLGTLIMYLFGSFFCAFFMTVIIHFLKNKALVRGMKIICISVFFIMGIVEGFTLYHYHTLMDAGMMNVLFETNWQETKEFLQMYISLPEICILLILMLICFGIKKRFKIKADFYLKKRWYVLGMLFLGMFLSVRFVLLDQEKRFVLPRFYTSIEKTMDNIKEYENLYKKVNGGADVVWDKSTIKNVIFIVGESTSRNHMGLYGYYLPNTPQLEKMNFNHEIFTFSDVISPHSHTSPVVAKLFTFSNYENQQPWYEQQNLISILNTVGYQTFWLSNQESSGAWGNVAQVFANLSVDKKFTRYRDSETDHAGYDEELFPLIDKAMERRKDKNFFVIHLMGSHGDYKNRYSKEYAAISEKDIISSFSERKKRTIAEYDNAIYYNDFIISEIIKRFVDEEAIVIYLSDHGEEVYDERDFVGHTENNGSRYMIEIPMVVWVSPKFAEMYPKKVEAIKRSVDKPYMTDDMMHTFLDLLDIKTAEFDKTRSLFSDIFNAQRKRIYNGWDYDKQMKSI